MSRLVERQQAREHGSSQPASEQPVTTPAPSATPSPDASPKSSDSMGRELVALTLAQSSPSAVLSQLAVPAASVPLLPGTRESNGVVGDPAALRSMVQRPVLFGSPDSPVNNPVDVPAVGSPVPAGANRFYVHMLDRNPVDVFRTGVPRPPKPAGNTLE